MEFEYGDLLVLETPYYGNAVMMVTNPPVVCGGCGKVVAEWDYGDDGMFHCPLCGHAEQSPEVARDADGNELMSLSVASVDDTGEDSPHDTPEYNWLVNRTYIFPRKSVEADVAAGRARVCGEREAFDRKCMIIWTNTEGYSAGAPVPEWIKDIVRGGESQASVH